MTLLARALDALHSRVEAIKDRWDAMFDVFPEGDSLDTDHTALEPKD